MKSNGFQSPRTFTADYSLKCSFETLIVTVVLILIGCRVRFLGGSKYNLIHVCTDNTPVAHEAQQTTDMETP